MKKSFSKKRPPRKIRAIQAKTNSMQKPRIEKQPRKLYLAGKRL